jgi:acyl phosphate:glycerol-3-phosphate acyltransferase
MTDFFPAAAALIGGYALGSVPVAVLAGRAQGLDPRQAGDGNPGFWNVKELAGWPGALPVLAGDALKGTAAGLLGRALGGRDLAAAAVAAAMAGHAWPAFAGLRGGRSVLTFAGGFAVLCPPAWALGVTVCAGTTLVTGSFAAGARTAVFTAPLLQLAFQPPREVAVTGALMSFIGLRFATAALSRRRRAARPARAPGR